jgi:hypothetical protein
VSTSSFESESATALARIELLQGILPAESAAQRSELYDSFGVPGVPWPVKARAAYAAMSEIGDYVASVGDQLACELDIREHAELFAAVGGFHPNEITHGLGGWWSPSATWFLSGGTLVARADLSEPASRDFPAASRLLLDAGAHNLASFFSRVAAGGLRLASAGGRAPWSRRRRREILFVAEVARARGLLFRDGPRADGRYLGREPVDVTELIEEVTRSRTASQSRTHTEATP